MATADNFDWRSVGGQCYVTPVRDQGSAPNCYVHAAVGAVESRYMLTRNETSFLVDLSETYLGLDPVGWAAGMLTTITNSGAQTEDGAGPGFCRITSSCSTISGSLDVIKSYLKRYGALAVTVGGHGCTLVGYQDDASLTAGGYWIIKDSFGTDWEGIPGSPGYTAALYGTLVPNRTCAVTGVAYFTGPLGARTWDTSDAAGCQGGSGTWSTSAAGWDGGRYRIAWHNGEDTATFGASNGAAVVTLDGRVSTYCLTFQTGGSYTLRGGSLVVTGGGICTNESTVLDTAITAGAPQTWTTANLCTLRVTQPVDFHISSLTIGGDGNTILEAGVRDVSLNPVFAGLVTNEYGGLGKSGAGTLSLGGHSQYCHDTTINQGALILDGNLICGGNIVLGTTGSATFIQRSGLCLLGGSVYVGCQAGASGRYQLLAGHVQEANAYVGVGGTGVFEQVDGNHACSTLTVGSSGSAGTYSLLAGTLQTTDEAVGPGGTFHQSGGLHSAGTLSVEAGGRFDLAGGTLTINRSFSVAGIVDFAGCGVLTVTTAAIDLSHADVRNPGQAAIHMDGNSVLVLPAGASESGYLVSGGNPAATKAALASAMMSALPAWVLAKSASVCAALITALGAPRDLMNAAIFGISVTAAEMTICAIWISAGVISTLHSKVRRHDEQDGAHRLQPDLERELCVRRHLEEARIQPRLDHASHVGNRLLGVRRIGCLQCRCQRVVVDGDLSEVGHDGDVAIHWLAVSRTAIDGLEPGLIVLDDVFDADEIVGSFRLDRNDRADSVAGASGQHDGHGHQRHEGEATATHTHTSTFLSVVEPLEQPVWHEPTVGASTELPAGPIVTMDQSAKHVKRRSDAARQLAVGDERPCLSEVVVELFQLESERADAISIGDHVAQEVLRRAASRRVHRDRLLVIFWTTNSPV